VNVRQRAMALVAAGLRTGKYARAGFDSCVTCGEVPNDEGARRRAFAVSLDLGIALGDGLAQAGDALELIEVGVDAQGVPYCARCAVAVFACVLAFAARPAPKGCPCASLELYEQLEGRLAQWAFACGLTLAGELSRCRVCVALGSLGAIRAEESSGTS
jgi:hypothetical protein